MTEVLTEKPLLFSVGSDMLEDRFDPMYYQPEYVYLINGLKNCPYEIRTIGEIADVENFGAYALYNEIKYVDEGGIPFLRVVDISEDHINVKNAVRISEESHDLLVKSKIIPNTVLLSMAGTIGITVVVPEDIGECNSNQDIAKITLKENVKEEVNHWYISAFLNSKLGQLQIQRASTGSTHPHIFLYSIKSFKIPIPPHLIQDDIANIMQNAYEERKNILQRADELLDSVNDLVLDELCIEVPKKKYEFYFSIKRANVNDRLDPYYYKPEYLDMIKILEMEKNKYKIKRLSDVVEFSKQTFSPTANLDKTFKYIKISDVDDEIGIITSFSELLGKDAPSRARKLIQNGDILISKLDGSLKSIAIVPSDLDGCVATTGFEIIKPKNVDGLYLHTLLRNDISQTQLKQRTTGAIMASISQDEMGSIIIPVPSREVMSKIVNEVGNRRDEIRNLRIRAETVVDETKKRIERIILGAGRGDN